MSRVSVMNELELMDSRLDPTILVLIHTNRWTSIDDNNKQHWTQQSNSYSSSSGFIHRPFFYRDDLFNSNVSIMNPFKAIIYSVWFFKKQKLSFFPLSILKSSSCSSFFECSLWFEFWLIIFSLYSRCDSHVCDAHRLEWSVQTA